MLPSGDRALTLQRFSLQSSTNIVIFGQRRVTLGAASDNDFIVNGPTVSRYHAQIEIDKDGYRLVDKNSKNGTFLSKIRIRDVFLQDQDTFQLGEASIHFSLKSTSVEIQFSAKNRFGNLFGTSERMREIFGLLGRVAKTDATVLIEGKSGTGKELVAEAIHKHSKRKSGPFVVFDCSAVSRELIASELFGHVKGAFTGAINTRKGAFERAEGGTLFLDELGELSPELQPKLLRVLENRRIQPVGGQRERAVDVRIVAATNRVLRDEVRSGNFREDLYYRFAVITIQLPVLADRKEDIPMLVEHFLKEVRKRMNHEKLNISFTTMEKLKAYHWPGNVRELKNFIERAAILATDSRVETRFLQLEKKVERPDLEIADLLSIAGIETTTPFKQAKAQLVTLFEKTYWTKILAKTRGNVSQAARIAGVHRKSVEYILRKLEINRNSFN